MPKSSTVDQIVGARVRLRRIQLGLEPSALAAALGVSEPQIKAYEAGRERIGAQALFMISRRLKVGAQFFFDSWIAETAIEVQARNLGKVAG